MRAVARSKSRTCLKVAAVALGLSALGTTGFAPMPLTKPAAAASVRVAPEGNRLKSQPKIPYSSLRRTSASKTSYDAKFERVVAMLKRESGLISSIKKVSKRYQIDPIHMIGAIIGEHTYNYDTLDSAQSYYVKALAYAGIKIRFAYDGEHVMDFVERDEFKKCHKDSIQKSSNKRWSCYEDVWNTRFLGKKVGDARYPKTNFNETFFQPLFAGQSFGLGQLSPLTVLKMTDEVAEHSSNRKLDARDEEEVYKATMDPRVSLHYMAAVIRDSIDAYKSVAKVDISKNPGLTATLYNLGDPWSRASKFRRSGRAWPRENYYGWLVNDKLKDLEALL